MALFKKRGYNTMSQGAHVNRQPAQTNTTAQNEVESCGGNEKFHRWEVTVNNKKIFFTTKLETIYMGERDALSTSTFLGFPLRSQMPVYWTIDFEVSSDINLNIDVIGPDGQGYGTGDCGHFLSLPIGEHYIAPSLDLKSNQHPKARKLVNIEGIGKRYLYGRLYWDNVDNQPCCKLENVVKQLRNIFMKAGKPL